MNGGGKPLPDAVCGQMEAALGADFSAVRVHVGPQAERIGAVAFTIGNDLYFAPGRFQPDTVQGKQLLGHELAHVVQQRQGRVRNPVGTGVAVVQDRALEAEADRMGRLATLSPVELRSKTAPTAARRSAALAQPKRLAARIPGHSSTLQRAGTEADARVNYTDKELEEFWEEYQEEGLDDDVVAVMMDGCTPDTVKRWKELLGRKKGQKAKEANIKKQQAVEEQCEAAALDSRSPANMACISWKFNGDTYHITQHLGVEHLTKEGNPKIHFYFERKDKFIDGQSVMVIEPAQGPGGTSYSSVPANVRKFVEKYYFRLITNYKN